MPNVMALISAAPNPSPLRRTETVRKTLLRKSGRVYRTLAFYVLHHGKFACHVLQELSNFYCLPGRAGGSPNGLGPMHPGSLGEQYNVCGKAGCRCKDPKKPQKHGPYYQLSYTWRGRSTTRFVRPERVDGMQRKVANYKRFRELVNEWVDLEVEREKAERAQEKHPGGH